MNKQQIFNETKAYEDREKYSLREIYSTCSQSSSSLRTLKKSKEFGLPDEKFDRCGVIPELSVVWYAFNYRLSLFRYESNEHEEISTFSSKVLFVDIFIPKKGIFNNKILYCFIVFTESQVIIYGVDRDSHALVNTNFVASTPSPTHSYILQNGSIFLGCEDGNVYEVIYKSLDSWSFKMMYLYSPNTTLIGNLVPSLFKRKKPKIVSMSATSKYLLTLSKNITVYNIEGGIFKVKDINIYKEYKDIQIIEEKYGEIFFYCVQEDGTRDFYDTKHLFTYKNSTLPVKSDNASSSLVSVKCYDKKFIMLEKNKYQGSIIHFITLNEFQTSNIDRNKSSENQEILSLTDEVLNYFIKDGTLFILSANKILFYEILTLKRFVTLSRVEDVYNLTKNLGQREALALYYELYSVNADISKLEYLCVKIEEAHLKGLFSFIYRNVKSFINLPVNYDTLNSDVVNTTVQKFRTLISKVKQSDLKEAVSFMNYFNQTVYYLGLLVEYNLSIKHKTLLQLVLNDESDWKKKSLDSLMEIFKTNQSLDSLISLLSNKAPDYLPLQEIYYHKGFDLLKKYPSKEKLWESLKNFKNVPFNSEIIKKYNDLKFYSGSVILLRKHFRKSHLTDYEETVKLLETAVKCQGAISIALEDKDEEFLYAFFDALINNLQTEIKGDCACCDTKTILKLSEIIKLESKFLPKYLEEKSESNNNPLIYELYWKYCAYRDDRSKAVESLINLIDFKPLTLEKRRDLLQKARTVSLHTPFQDEIKKRSSLLEIQLELIERGEDSKTIKVLLLPCDVLFNDYAYKYPDLALKIIDISSFKDKKVIKKFLVQGMDSSKPIANKNITSNGELKSSESEFKYALNFLLKNNFMNLDCEMVGDILLEKMSKDDNLTKALFDVGFTYQEVQKYIENKIKTEDDTEFKNFLLEDFRQGSGDKKDCKKLEQYCIV